MKNMYLDQNNIWFTSDTHFNDVHICEGEVKPGVTPKKITRNFQNIDSMNTKIIDNINSLVKENDILFHLGDFSLTRTDKIKQFRDRILCKNVHLILGNHDRDISLNIDKLQLIFSSVNNYLELQLKFQLFILSHYPISSWNGLNRGSIHLHGHVHLSIDEKMGVGKKMDIGMDGNGLMPYSINDIIKLMELRPIKSDIDKDYHLE